MTVKRILVATPYAKDLERWQSILSTQDELQIKAHSPGLMELFNQVEHDPPHLVLVSADLCALEEFELVMTLFKVLDVRWLKFKGLNHVDTGPAADAEFARRGGLFELSLLDSEKSLVSTIRSAVLASQQRESRVKQPEQVANRRFKRMILIGSSTGGVDALKEVLAKFGRDCPPTVVVQHTSKGFGEGLVRVLSRSCAARIELFEPNAPLRSGTVYIVAGLKRHAVLTSDKQPRLKSGNEQLKSGHCPSIDVLFASSVPFATRIVGCILTGMGTDGAEGLLHLRQAGARTISQDRDSSVVYGMPAAAWSLGGSMQQVPLKAIGETLLREAAL